MKLKHSLIILVIGYCFDFIGALFKIMHWDMETRCSSSQQF